MLSRRSLLLSTFGVAATYAGRYARAESQEFQEQGDPNGDVETIAYDPDYVSSLINVPRPAFKITDPVENFSEQLIAVAERYDGKDRWNDEKDVTAMLGLFGCPFKQNGNYLAFCAAGIGYCAATVFAEASGKSTKVDDLRALLPIIDIWNYYPSPGVLNMSEVARGKSRWISRSQTPKRGWLVVYDWSGSDNPQSTSHTGIVLGVTGSSVETFEFNTGNEEHPGGGTIGRKHRAIDKTVKGYINTNTRSIRSAE